MKPECRRAKKAVWKRTKMHTDANFRQDQRLFGFDNLKLTPEAGTVV
jgi:hypothetical protein